MKASAISGVLHLGHEVEGLPAIEQAADAVHDDGHVGAVSREEGAQVDVTGASGLELLDQVEGRQALSVPGRDGVMVGIEAREQVSPRRRGCGAGGAGEGGHLPALLFG